MRLVTVRVLNSLSGTHYCQFVLANDARVYHLIRMIKKESLHPQHIKLKVMVKSSTMPTYSGCVTFDKRRRTMQWILPPHEKADLSRAKTLESELGHLLDVKSQPVLEPLDSSSSDSDSSTTSTATEDQEAGPEPDG